MGGLGENAFSLSSWSSSPLSPLYAIFAFSTGSSRRRRRRRSRSSPCRRPEARTRSTVTKHVDTLKNRISLATIGLFLQQDTSRRIREDRGPVGGCRRSGRTESRLVEAKDRVAGRSSCSRSGSSRERRRWWWGRRR